ncbi:hypothetical protein CK203_099995 [Vitis vinifera]|uniref:Uncharacterized protein n=1 Tax=Vitis vinifera TaxID=29760 RepID=A0A438DI74_VITVI|nr:hypothetical protein CK203_099995 [Vitis vinifera]
MAVGSSPPYGRLSETVVMGRGPWQVVVISCKTRFTLVNDPDNHIRITHVDYPDVLWSGRIYESRPDVYALLGRVKDFGMGFGSTLGLKNVCKQENCLVCPAGDAREKSIDKLSVKEFRDRFCIPNGVMVEFLNEGEDVVSTEKAEERAITFSKNNLTSGFGSLFRRCSRNSSISPRFHQPSFIQHRPGADGLLFRSPALPSIGDGASDSTKGGAKGHVVVRGPEKRGHIVDWVEKASFACLNKLFEIDAKERHYKTLLSARNRMRSSGSPRIMSSIFSPGSC